MQRYPKSQSLMKSLEEEWGRKERKQAPILFKDLLKDRPKWGNYSKRRGTAGNLEEQMKRSARTVDPLRLQTTGPGGGCGPGSPTACSQRRSVPEAAGSPGRAIPDRRSGPRRKGGCSSLLPYLPTTGPGVCRSYGGL